MRWILAIALLACLPCWATDYYVDGDNGSDSNDGLTEGNAKITIQAAVNLTIDGDAVYVQNNGSTVYSEAVTTDQSIWLIGYGSTVGDMTRAVIDGTSTVIPLTCDNNSQGAECVIANFELKNSVGDGLNADQTTHATVGEMTFFNIWSHDNAGDGFYFGESLFNQVHNCTANDNGEHGFLVGAGGRPATYLYRCVAGNNTSHGFDGSNNNVSYVAINCVSVNNSGGGFLRGSQVNCVADKNTGEGFWGIYGSFVGCVSTRNTAYGFKYDVASFAQYSQMSYQRFAGSGSWANTSGAVTGEANAIEFQVQTLADPKFAAAYDVTLRPNPSDWDYRTTSGSPLQGVTQYVGMLSEQETNADIGALQHTDAGGGSQLVNGGLVK